MMQRKTAGAARQNSAPTQERVPSAAIGYFSKSKKGNDYIKLIIDLNVLGLGEGSITLFGYDNSATKKKETHPDLRFVVADEKGSSAPTSGGRSAATPF